MLITRAWQEHQNQAPPPPDYGQRVGSHFGPSSGPTSLYERQDELCDMLQQQNATSEKRSTASDTLHPHTPPGSNRPQASKPGQSGNKLPSEGVCIPHNGDGNEPPLEEADAFEELQRSSAGTGVGNSGHFDAQQQHLNWERICRITVEQVQRILDVLDSMGPVPSLESCTSPKCHMSAPLLNNCNISSVC